MTPTRWCLLNGQGLQLYHVLHHTFFRLTVNGSSIASSLFLQPNHGKICRKPIKLCKIICVKYTERFSWLWSSAGQQEGHKHAAHSPQCPLSSCMWLPWQLYTEATAHPPCLAMPTLVRLSELRASDCFSFNHYQGLGLLIHLEEVATCVIQRGEERIRKEEGLWKKGWVRGEVIYLMLMLMMEYSWFEGVVFGPSW